jgi:hypothetical protein
MPRPERLAPQLLGVLGAVELILGIWMVVAPRSFYDGLGGFGTYNAHYLRDVATFELALGIGSLLAVRRPTWWVPVLTIAGLQFALHAVNHVVDAHAANHLGVGIFDAVSLALVALILGWTARGVQRAPQPPASTGS